MALLLDMVLYLGAMPDMKIDDIKIIHVLSVCVLQVSPFLLSGHWADVLFFDVSGSPPSLLTWGEL